MTNKKAITDLRGVDSFAPGMRNDGTLNVISPEELPYKRALRDAEDGDEGDDLDDDLSDLDDLVGLADDAAKSTGT